MQKFFSSIWTKCITCLLLIVLISGCTLSVLNDVLYVSSEERTNRAIKKIYGEEKQNELIYDDNQQSEKFDYGFGVINTIYKVNDEVTNYLLFKSTGNQGYKNGTITVWVSVIVKGENSYDINKVLLDSFEKQTLMSKLTNKYYGNFNLEDVTEAYKSGKDFTTDSNAGEFSNPVSGATYSANAGNNAVNAVIKYLGEN